MKTEQMDQVHRIFLIFCLLIVPFVYSPTLLDYFHHSRFIVSSAGLAVCSAWIGWQARKSKPMKVGVLELAMLLFVALNFISILWAHQRSEATFYAQKWLILGSTFLITKIALKKNWKQKVYFISQLGAFSTLVILCIIGVKLALLFAESGLSNKSLYDLKVLFGHKSLISAYLALLIPVNLIGQDQRAMSLRPVILALVGWQIITIILLQSRAMYLALFVTFCLLLFYLFHSRQRAQLIRPKMVALATIAIVGGLGLLLALAGPDLRNRLNPALYFESQTSGERRFVWYKTQGLLHDHPILGVGAGNWKLEFPKFGVEGAYRLQDQDVIFTRAHNDFLELWAELGPFGLLLYLIIFLFPLFYLLRTPNEKYGLQRYLISAGIFTFMISSVLDFPKERIAFLTILGIYLALADKHISWRIGSVKKNKVHVFMWLMSALLLFNVFVGVHRYKGEMFARKLFNARAAQRWDDVVSLAKQSSNRWHRLDPSAVPMSFYEGIALYSLQQENKALDAFLRAYEANPYNFHIINNIATVLVSQSKFDEALDYLYRALSINPRFEEAIYNLAYCLNALGRKEEALIQIKLLPNDSEKRQVFLRELTKNLDR